MKRAREAREALAAEETEEAREARQARNPSLYPRTVWERDGGYWGAAKRNPGRVSGALIAALLLAGLAGEAGYNGEDSVVRKYAGKAYSKAQDSMAWVREYLASLMAKEGAK